MADTILVTVMFNFYVLYSYYDTILYSPLQTSTTGFNFIFLIEARSLNSFFVEMYSQRSDKMALLILLARQVWRVREIRTHVTQRPWQFCASHFFDCHICVAYDKRHYLYS